MATETPLTTRKDFLRNLAGLALLPTGAPAQSTPPKLLLVVAHPDDEYMCAASTYRLVHELGWTADQVVISNGESGYRYASLAESVYGVALSTVADARANLPAIRKEEVVQAGKILGIRQHYFLDQRDLGFSTSAAQADTSNWDRPHISQFLSDLLNRERYDAVFTLIPTAQTHGHHRAATILALEAVSLLPPDRRPLIFGVDANSRRDPPPSFTALPSVPLTVPVSADSFLVFDRTTSFGYHHALNYQIVVNWVIAAHISQGLFQVDAGRHELEQFWLFKASGNDALARARKFRADLCTGK
jgi:LmbE family N-acetylglucosaminyl deacetylase